MRRWIYLALMAVLFTTTAQAEWLSVTRSSTGTSAKIYRNEITSSVTAGVYTIGEAWTSAQIDFVLGSAFSGTLYVCAVANADLDLDGSVDTAAGCDSVVALSADASSSKVTGKQYYVLDINTAESGSNISRLTIRGTNEQAKTGGVLGEGPLSEMALASPSFGDLWLRDDAGAALDCTTDDSGSSDVLCMYTDAAVWAPAGGAGSRNDNDGDNLYEAAYLWDADGDGSVMVTCSDKDVPDVACKVEGERIYRDFTDDINCAMHGCGFGQMETNGTIYLEDNAVYVNWPCWDYAEPAGFNDPAAANDDLHDSTADTAWDHCPATPSGTGRRFISVARMGWQGNIIGGGFDTRNPETTTGYKRDLGTYLADDRGPQWNTGAQIGQNTWFGIDGFIRGINFGFHSQLGPAGVPSGSGEWTADGDSKGWGTADGDQSINAFNGSLCVADNSSTGTVSANGWAATLVAGDWITIEATSQDPTGATAQTVIAAMRVRDTPSAECNGAGTLDIPLGGRVASGTGGDFGSNPQLITEVSDGFYVTAARSDFFTASGTIDNVTIEPQDWWNESGGDCGQSGMWGSTADGAAADYDCDTNPLVGLWGAGNYEVGKNVVFRHWHQYAVDGASNPGNPVIRARYFYGNGGPIMDYGSGWNFEDIEVWNSQFGTSLISSFGVGVNGRGLKIYNSTFQQIINMNEGQSYNRFEDIQVYASAFTRLFTVNCGNRFNQIRNIKISGHEDQQGTDTNGVVARLTCSDTSNPIEGNVFDGVFMTGPGAATGGTGVSNAAIVFDTDAVIGTSNAAAIRDNRFVGFTYIENGNSLNVKPMLFSVQDDAATSRDVGPDFSLEDVFENNVFYGNSVRLTGGSGTARVYGICGLFDAGGDASSNRCEDPLEGSGNTGADPRGCLNSENGAKPSFEVCD